MQRDFFEGLYWRAGCGSCVLYNWNEGYGASGGKEIRDQQEYGRSDPVTYNKWSHSSSPCSICSQSQDPHPQRLPLLSAMLIERKYFRSADPLYGVDIYAEGIQKARDNTAVTKMPIHLENWKMCWKAGSRYYYTGVQWLRWFAALYAECVKAYRSYETPADPDQRLQSGWTDCNLSG